MTKSSTVRTNVDIFVRALMQYHPVLFRGYTYKMIKAGGEIVCPSGIYEVDYDVLVTLATMTTGNKEEQVMMPCDMSFNDLSRMCQDMTEEERFDIVASQVLYSERKRHA